MRTRIKICGLTREADVAAACAAGADAVGFVCYPKSPRYVDPHRLHALAREVGPFTTPVLLFVNAAPDLVDAAREAVHEFRPGTLDSFFGNRESRKLFPHFILCFLRVKVQLGTGNFQPQECV